MTTARIIVEIPDDMKGKTFSFKDGDSFKYKTPPTTIPMNCKYASIYSNSDGYIEDGLGDKLRYKYLTFVDIMENIICGGDCSFIGTPYLAWRNEPIERVGAKFTNDINEIHKENYNYLFKTDGKWYCQTNLNDEYSDFTIISQDNSVAREKLIELKKNLYSLKNEFDEKLNKLINEVDSIYEKAE